VTSLVIADGIKIEMPRSSYTPKEAEAGQWPPAMKPSEWAARYRHLTEDESDLRGPWDNDAAPYLVGMMDLGAAPGVRRLTVKKAVQGGISEAFRNCMGYWAHTDPAPMGLALPSQEKGEQIVGDKVVPFFRRTPVLKNLFSPRAHDVKKGQIKLANNFILYLMWSGSATSMASNPMKRAISDETDKFAPWTGQDAGPIELIDKRMRTYSDALHVLISSPTTRHGPISTNFRDSGFQLYYLVECPKCGTWQRLVWGGVKWPDSIREIPDRIKAAEAVIEQRSVWYECRHCEYNIDERQKRQLVRAGRWGTVGENKVTAGGRIVDASTIESWPDGCWIGMQISALYWLWESSAMHFLVAEWLRAQNDPSKLFDFFTGTLGEEWEQQTGKASPHVFSAKTKLAEHPERVLPWWTDRLVAAVDTQSDHFYIVLRAWGAGLVSRRIWHGRVDSFEELDEACFATVYHYEDDWLPPLTVDVMLIDTGGTVVQIGQNETGSRTQQVYSYCLKRRARVRPIKGASKVRETAELFWRGRGVFNPAASTRSRSLHKIEMPLWFIDTHQSQNLLQEMILNAKVEFINRVTGEVLEGPQWGLNQRQDKEYNRHMANMHRVLDRDKGQMVERWVPVTDGASVDYRDCEVYQVAAAYMRGVHLLTSLHAWAQQRKQAVKQARRPRSSGGVTTPDGRPFLVTQRQQ